MGLRICSYSAELHEPLFEFYGRVYPGRDLRAYARVWQWFYFENPDDPKPEESLILVVEDDRIIGHLGTIYTPFVVGSQRVVGRVGCDLMVVPEYRDRAIGAYLLREWVSRCDISLAMGVNPDAHYLYERMGWTTLACPALLFKRLSSRYYVGRLTGARWAGALGHHLTQPLCRVVDGLRGRLGGHDDFTLEPWDTFPEALEERLAERVERSGFTPVRSCARLNWRFARSPACDYRIFGAYRGEALCGYVVLGVTDVPKRRRSARIFDWYMFEDDVTLRQSFWSSVVDQAYRLGADHIRLTFYPESDSPGLRQRGWRPRGPLAAFARDNRSDGVDLGALAGEADLRDGDADSW